MAARSAFAAGRAFAVLAGTAGAAGAASLGGLDLAGIDVGAERGAFGLVEFAVPVLVVLGDEFGRGTLPATAAGAVVGVGVLRSVLRGSGDGGGGDEGEEQEALDDVFHRIR